ncbi:hypothetical protein PQ460_07895 [Paenibacillus sp. KACC 21273]|uniref:hypothetical protein n=1 Tax=Paenibacillus sp. KACC 21273 TaxID=3025665 RepID=UPI00236580BC|nr:hypothetical protein [Paenibacillus sp. KACC 21273]WDF52319.1 hypothetical protein PQ460_07895 [Paenibacillus sp. KACC 21273]
MEDTFFYVYDRKLAKHLRYDHGIEFVCTGLHTKTKDQFWMFKKNENLYRILVEFKKN